MNIGMDNLKYKKFSFINQIQLDCYSRNSSFSNYTRNTNTTEEPELWCPKTFDGFACWDMTPADSIAFQPCPYFVIGFDPRFQAIKRCTTNGTWYSRDGWNKSFTNYSKCVDVEDLAFRMFVNSIYTGGYAVSLIALFISLGIFTYFRALHCIRVKVHCNLFMALALNNFFWIFWHQLVIKNPKVVANNEVWCQVFYLVNVYLMLCSYLWMFCEGLHLHISLAMVFFKDDLAMKWFYFVGWALSFIIVAVYALARYYLTGDTTRCWIEQSSMFWIIITPVAITVVLSLGFIINVVRIIMTKVHPNRNNATVAKKAARATLILVPLFGVHFFLIPLQPKHNAPDEKPYQIVASILTSFQGLVVSILFCFTNQDVWATIKTHFKRRWSGRDGLPMTDFLPARRARDRPAELQQETV